MSTRAHQQRKNITIKVGFFGDGQWACNALERLHNDPRIKIRFVALRHKKPDEQLKRMAINYELTSICPENINGQEFLNFTEQRHCDILISMSYDQIYRQEIINIPRMGIINCHAGKLPFYRGRNVLNWVLINDESEFGITVHYVDEGIDTGDIILQKTFPITDNDDYSTLLEKASFYCAKLLHRAVDIIIAQKVKPIQQANIHPIGSYCSKRKEGDEYINWNSTSREIFNFVRALCRPGPVAKTRYDESEILINKVEMVPRAPVYIGIPGAVLLCQEDIVFIKTKDTFIKITEYHKIGKKLRPGDRLR